MIYVICSTLIVAALVFGLMARFSKDSRDRDVSSFSFILSGVLAFAMLVPSIIGLMGSSTTSLPEYAKTIAAQVPRLKGKFICDDISLKFEGTHEVLFSYNGRPYRVDYPVSGELADFTVYCPLDIKPTEQDIIDGFNKYTAMRSDRIENVLKTRIIPSDIPEIDRKFLQPLLSSIAPVVAQEATPANLNKPQSTDSSVASVTKDKDAVRVAVPSSLLNPKPVPTSSTAEELVNKNISAQ